MESEVIDLSASFEEIEEADTGNEDVVVWDGTDAVEEEENEVEEVEDPSGGERKRGRRQSAAAAASGRGATRRNKRSETPPDVAAAGATVSANDARRYKFKRCVHPPGYFGTPPPTIIVPADHALYDEVEERLYEASEGKTEGKVLAITIVYVARRKKRLSRRMSRGPEGDFYYHLVMSDGSLPVCRSVVAIAKLI